MLPFPIALIIVVMLAFAVLHRDVVLDPVLTSLDDAGDVLLRFAVMFNDALLVPIVFLREAMHEIPILQQRDPRNFKRARKNVTPS